MLFAGDEVFRIRIAELQSTAQYVSKMLHFQELPNAVSVHNGNYDICYFEQIYGTLTHVDGDHSCQSNHLKKGIELLFTTYNQGLIIV